LEVTSVRRIRRREGVTLHRVDDLLPGDVTTVHRVPLTSCTRTLIDLPAVARLERVERALDDALRRRVTSMPALWETFERVGSRGRPGMRGMRTLLEQRDVASAPVESLLEARLIRLLAKNALPAPVCQHEVRDGDRVVARVDLAYPDMLIAIEADGYAHHSARVSWQRDLRRANALIARGWRILRFSWEDVHERPTHVVSEVRNLLLGNVRRGIRM
jgi:very-short-patch-repair endonuclease